MVGGRPTKGETAGRVQGSARILFTAKTTIYFKLSILSHKYILCSFQKYYINWAFYIEEEYM